MKSPDWIIRRIIVFALLLFEAVSDARKMKINIVPPVVTAALSLPFIIIAKEPAWPSALIGLGEGAILVFASFATDGQIGIGDGIILGATGLMLGWKNNLLMFFFACIFSAVFAAFKMVIKKADRKSRIPFVPFILSGFLFGIFLMR